MNDQIQPLYQLMSGHFGWLPTLVSWIGAARIALKFVNARVQAFLTQRMATAAAEPDQAEERDWEAVLSARWYRMVNFSLDLVLSIKLPVLSDLQKLKAASAATAGTTATSTH